MNSLIEEIFKNFVVDDVEIPVSFLRYDGHKTTYVTYMETHKDTSLSADDKIINYVDYYDIDIYSKSNYIKIIDNIKEKMEQNGFTWQPSQDSGDMYEDDTGYFHKTICFAIERSINNG